MQLTFFAAERPAKDSLSLDSEADWTMIVLNYRWSLLRLLGDTVPKYLFGKMSPESFQVTRDETLEHFWDCLPEDESQSPEAAGKMRELSQATSGLTALHGESLTLNLPEAVRTPERCPSEGVVSSLQDILETGGVPQRFYLSGKACAGILRRAAKRGKVLPPQLRAALQAVAGSELTLTATEV